MSGCWTAGLLARTYFFRVSAYRPLANGGRETLCEAAPCALGRTAQVSAPKPSDMKGPFPEAAYNLTLYTRPELRFRLGDRLEIDDGARLWLATASDSFPYPGHTVTVVEVRQVTDKET